MVEHVADCVGDWNIECVELEGDIPFFGVLYGAPCDQHSRKRILQSQREDIISYIENAVITAELLKFQRLDNNTTTATEIS